MHLPADWLTSDEAVHWAAVQTEEACAELPNPADAAAAAAGLNTY